MKQKTLANLLIAVVALITLIGSFLIFFWVPVVGEQARIFPETQPYVTPALIYIWATALPFYAGLWQGLRVCLRIRSDRSFCLENARSLTLISWLALSECIIYLLFGGWLCWMHFVNFGVLFFLVCIESLGIILTVGAAVLSHLVRKAAELQTESDFTV